MKTLFPKSALSRRVASFSSLPYSLIIRVKNKEIRENYRCDRFLLRELFGNKGLILNPYMIFISRDLIHKNQK